MNTETVTPRLIGSSALLCHSFVVAVLPDDGRKEKQYTVQCHTSDDAMQIAFALDGGWGKDRDASGLLELAKAYCRIVSHERVDGKRLRIRRVA